MYDEIADAAYIGEQQGSTTYTSGGSVVDLSNYVQTSGLKTINNQSILGSGNLTLSGEPGAAGVGIASIEQTVESTTPGGTNELTITKTDGTSSTFNVRNGDAVGSATIVQTTGDSTTAVMSQDGTTKAIAAGAQSVKTGTSVIFPNRSVTKLSATQVAALNVAEEITIKWVMKSAMLPEAYRYIEFCGLLPYYFIRFSYFGTCTVNPTLDPNSHYLGMHVNGSNAAMYSTWSNQCVVINRVTGRVRWYQNTTLLVDETSDDYKAEKFVSDDGYLMMATGDYETRFYALQIYDCDMSIFWTYPTKASQQNAALWTSGYGNTLWSSVSGNFRKFGYQLIKTNRLEKFYGESGHTASGGSAQLSNPYYVTFTAGTSVSGTSGMRLCYRSGNTTATPYSMQCKLEYWYLNVSGGTIAVTWDSTKPYWYDRRAAKVYDASTGDEVSDYNNIGDGDYVVVFPSIGYTGVQVTYMSGSPTITETDFGYKAVCCVVDMRMDTTYDGKLLDNEADTEYIFYLSSGRNYASCVSAWTNKVDAGITLTSLPIQDIYDANIISASPTLVSTRPPVSGDIIIRNGAIYYGDAVNHVWKQINNA